MPGGYAYGWTGAVWTQLLCNDAGELLLDSAAIFEDTPTDGELEKGPTSNWAFDHDADVAAHHAKYTDADARAAFDDVFGSDGHCDKTLYVDYQNIYNIKLIRFKPAAGATKRIIWDMDAEDAVMSMYCQDTDLSIINFDFRIRYGADFLNVIHQGIFQAELALYLEEAPTNGVVNKAPTSNWAFDHDADVAAHHAKYTDLEAQQACGLDGDLYHTIPGLDFRPADPNGTTYNYESDAALKIGEDNIDVYCPVKLPDGVTVTAVKVNGNAGASSQTWTLYRYTLAAGPTAMASAVVGAEDTTISDPVISNILYMYFINIVGLDTDDEINSVVIKYTL